MLTFNHPMLILLAAATCAAVGISLTRFFFSDAGGYGSFRAKIVGFVGILVIVFLAVYSLASRVVGPICLARREWNQSQRSRYTLYCPGRDQGGIAPSPRQRIVDGLVLGD